MRSRWEPAAEFVSVNARTTQMADDPIARMVDMAFESRGSPEVFDKIMQAYWPKEAYEEAKRTFEQQERYIARNSMHISHNEKLAEAEKKRENSEPVPVAAATPQTAPMTEQPPLAPAASDSMPVGSSPSLSIFDDMVSSQSQTLSQEPPKAPEVKETPKKEQPRENEKARSEAKGGTKRRRSPSPKRQRGRSRVRHRDSDEESRESGELSTGDYEEEGEYDDSESDYDSRSRSRSSRSPESRSSRSYSRSHSRGKEAKDRPSAPEPPRDRKRHPRTQPTYRVSHERQFIFSILRRRPADFYHALKGRASCQLVDLPRDNGKVACDLVVRWMFFEISMRSRDFANKEEAHGQVLRSLKAFFAVLLQKKSLLFWGNSLATFCLRKVPS